MDKTPWFNELMKNYPPLIFHSLQLNRQTSRTKGTQKNKGGKGLMSYPNHKEAFKLPTHTVMKSTTRHAIALSLSTYDATCDYSSLNSEFNH